MATNMDNDIIRTIRLIIARCNELYSLIDKYNKTFSDNDTINQIVSFTKDSVLDEIINHYKNILYDEYTPLLQHCVSSEESSLHNNYNSFKNTYYDEELSKYDKYIMKIHELIDLFKNNKDKVSNKRMEMMYTILISKNDGWVNWLYDYINNKYTQDQYGKLSCKFGYKCRDRFCYYGH